MARRPLEMYCPELDMAIFDKTFLMHVTHDRCGLQICAYEDDIMLGLFFRSPKSRPNVGVVLASMPLLLSQ